MQLVDSGHFALETHYVEIARLSKDSAAHQAEGNVITNNKKCIVFDVNETLLDLDTMRPIFERIFKDPSAVRLWFQTLILYSEALTLARVYVQFTDIGATVLEMFAKTRGVTVSADDKRELTDRFETMPAHPEVQSAIGLLRGARFRLFTLTDNLLEIQTRQLEHAGIAAISSAASAWIRKSSVTSWSLRRTRTWSSN